MDSAEFLTPPRILIPKLLRSRDGWKRKAALRKAQAKALAVKARDLAVSRDRHAARADRGEAECRELRQRLAALEAALAERSPPPPAPEKKLPRGRAADTFPAPCSGSP